MKGENRVNRLRYKEDRRRKTRDVFKIVGSLIPYRLGALPSTQLKLLLESRKCAPLMTPEKAQNSPFSLGAFSPPCFSPHLSSVNFRVFCLQLLNASSLPVSVLYVRPLSLTLSLMSLVLVQSRVACEW
jgi:hypothetical protein